MLQDDQDPVLRGRSRYIPQNRPSGGSIHSPDFLTLHGKVHRCASLRLEAVSRYKQTGIKEVQNGIVSGQTVQLNTQDYDTAKATFCNQITTYQNFSHNDLEINEFGK